MQHDLNTTQNTVEGRDGPNAETPEPTAFATSTFGQVSADGVAPPAIHPRSLFSIFKSPVWVGDYPIGHVGDLETDVTCDNSAVFYDKTANIRVVAEYTDEGQPPVGEVIEVDGVLLAGGDQGSVAPIVSAGGYNFTFEVFDGECDRKEPELRYTSTRGDAEGRSPPQKMTWFLQGIKEVDQV